MVRYVRLDSLMKRLPRLTLSKSALLAPTAGTKLYCYDVWSSYCLLHRENYIDIRDLFKTKLQKTVV